MSAQSTADRVAQILDRREEADDVLRDVVEALTQDGSLSWAGIAFLEDGELVLGPRAGRRLDGSPEVTVAIAYDGGSVGELRVQGEIDADALERVAALLSPYVLVGWDTRGEAWEP